MVRELAITKRQAKTLMRAATEERCIVEVQTSIGTIRIVPLALVESVDDPNSVIGVESGRAQASLAAARASAEGLIALGQMRRKSRGRTTGRDDSNQDLHAMPTPERRIRFFKGMMYEDDEEGEYCAAVTKAPLGKRERQALAILYEGRGRVISARETKGIGVATWDPLQGRGYVVPRADGVGWQITAAGEEAVVREGLSDSGPRSK